MLGRLQSALGGKDEENQEDDILTQMSDASTLSFKTRIIAFGVCFGIGILLSLIGSIMVFFLQYTAFGIMYSCGSLLALLSTCFLMGPVKQCKKMFDKTRVFATIVVFLMIALTFVAGFVAKNGILCLLCVALQFLAMTWYSISYIPFARDAVLKCVGM